MTDINKVFTADDAYAAGYIDGHEASQRGEHLSMGMTWGDNQDFNEAYDHGVNVAQKAFVLKAYPEARAFDHEVEGQTFWAVDATPARRLADLMECEYEAWEQAAARVGRALKTQAAS
jgi:hypothetical protein